MFFLGIPLNCILAFDLSLQFGSLTGKKLNLITATCPLCNSLSYDIECYKEILIQQINRLTWPLAKHLMQSVNLHSQCIWRGILKRERFKNSQKLCIFSYRCVCFTFLKCCLHIKIVMICNLCKLYKCRFKSVPFPTFLFHSLSKVCKDFGNLQKSLRRLVVWSVTDSDYWLFCSISVRCCWAMHTKPNPTFREELTFEISKTSPLSLVTKRISDNFANCHQLYWFIVLWVPSLWIENIFLCVYRWTFLWQGRGENEIHPLWHVNLGEKRGKEPFFLNLLLW